MIFALFSHSCSPFAEEMFLNIFATPWTIAHWALLFMGFSGLEYWSGLLFSSPGDFPDPGIEPESPAVIVFSLLIISQQHPCFYFSVSLTNYVVPILRESNIVNANFQDFMSWARVLGSNFVLVGKYSATQARREN